MKIIFKIFKERELQGLTLGNIFVTSMVLQFTSKLYPCKLNEDFPCMNPLSENKKSFRCLNILNDE